MITRRERERGMHKQESSDNRHRSSFLSTRKSKNKKQTNEWTNDFPSVIRAVRPLCIYTFPNLFKYIVAQTKYTQCQCTSITPRFSLACWLGVLLDLAWGLTRCGLGLRWPWLWVCLDLARVLVRCGLGFAWIWLVQCGSGITRSRLGVCLHLGGGWLQWGFGVIWIGLVVVKLDHNAGDIIGTATSEGGLG